MIVINHQSRTLAIVVYGWVVRPVYALGFVMFCLMFVFLMKVLRACVCHAVLFGVVRVPVDDTT